MDFNDIASVSGKGVLFRVVNPTRTGVILETLDDEKKKMVATLHNKVSILSEISIYTTDSKGAVPLEEVMKKIHEEFNGDTDLDKNSSAEELKSFMKFVLPDYDENRVYVSDIRKLVSWYAQIAARVPELLLAEKDEKDNTPEDKEAKDA